MAGELKKNIEERGASKMKREEQIKVVCSMLSMSERYDGEKIGFFVDEVKQYMLSAGVPLLLVNDRRAIGCIARGVSDLYTYHCFRGGKIRWKYPKKTVHRP